MFERSFVDNHLKEGPLWEPYTASDKSCPVHHLGYGCTLAFNHKGPHKAHITNGEILYVWHPSLPEREWVGSKSQLTIEEKCSCPTLLNGHWPDCALTKRRGEK